MTSTLTAIYSSTHRTLTELSRAHGLKLTDGRVAVAIYEEGRTTTSDKLEGALKLEGSGLRRAISVLRVAGMVSGGARRGKREPIVLTEKGVSFCQEFFDKVEREIVW